MNPIASLIDANFAYEMAGREMPSPATAKILLACFEMGMLLPELYNQIKGKLPRSNTKPHEANPFIEKNIQRCFCLLLNSEHHDQFMAVAAIGTARVDYFKNANRLQYDRCFVRKQDGSLFSNAELKRLVRERSSIDALLLSAAKTNDQDAYHQMRKIRAVESRAGVDSIMQFAAQNQVVVSPDFLDAFTNAKKSTGIDVNNYVGILKGCIVADALKNALANVYDPTLTPALGHELFHALFSQNGFFTGEVGKSYVKILVKDGGDWFIGLKQHLEGSHAYLGLLTRTPQPLEELDQLIQHGRKKQNQRLVAAILEALPQELIMDYASTQPKANAIFRINRLDCIKNRVSKSLHLDNLNTDLGL